MLWGGILFCLVLSACGGCLGATEGVCPTEVQCGSLERCVQGQCVALTDVVCIPDCGDGEMCEQGSCISVVSTCSEPGQTCDRTKPFSGEFVCLDWDGFNQGSPSICSNPCAQDGTCPTGEACFLLSGIGSTEACDAQTPCPSGHICRSGTCQAAACRPSECSGFLSGQSKCDSLYDGRPGFERGTQCYELPDETRFCFSAGQKKVGEQCVDTLEGLDSENFDQMCGQGLACVQGLCQQACSDTSGCEQEQQTCLFAQEDLVGKGVGFCGKECKAFSTGECGAQGKCLPIDADKGYCVPAGNKEAFGTCTPLAWDCEEGLICTELASGQGRCTPMCNLTVAPRTPGAPVTREDQLQRDATCPQPPDIAYSYLRLMHAAPRAGALELRIDGQVILESLEPGALATATQDENAQGIVVLSPGQHSVELFKQGAGALDEPLAQESISFGRDRVDEFVLVDSQTPGSMTLQVRQLGQRKLNEDPPPSRGVVHYLADVSEPLEVVFSPKTAGAMPQRVVLQSRGERVGAASLMSGLFDVEVVRQASAEVVFARQDVDLSQGGDTLYLVGEVGALGGAGVLLYQRSAEVLPQIAQAPPYMVCNALDNPTYGYCQETCASIDEYTRNRCQGDEMGCYPQRIQTAPGWQSVCAPGGVSKLGDRCDPASEVPECATGAYCLEYGNEDEQVVMGAPRGVCTSLCDTRQQDELVLSCAQNQVCVPLAPGALDIGQCQFGCDPGASYSDAMCPVGLRSCKPAAALVEDSMSTGQRPPRVVPLDAVCSSSGIIPEGSVCVRADCAPGTECMYPRSPQATLLSTLLSPYFGSRTQSPTCRAQCDPFDGTMSDSRCASGETCLVNFPWSADVGHCAPVVERVNPMQACTRPGESCGEDSVCILDGGQPLCLRLCEYTGGPGGGNFNQSTCPGGLQCSPFVNDVGICR